MKALFVILSFPLMNFAIIISRVRADFFLEEASVVKEKGCLPLFPITFIVRLQRNNHHITI